MNTNAPITPTTDESAKPKKRVGLYIVIVLVAIIAAGGVGFSIFEFFSIRDKNLSISDLESQVDKLEQKVSTLSSSSKKVETDETQQETSSGLVSDALNEEKSIPWPADTERMDGEPETITSKVRIPKINLDTEGANQINQKISDTYSGYASEDSNNWKCKGPCSVSVTYDTLERDNILYLIIGTRVQSYRATGYTNIGAYYYDISSEKELGINDLEDKYTDIRISVSGKEVETIIPSVLNSFDYYYRDEQVCNYSPRLGCEFMNNTF
ncbi:hypothetical protein IJG20_02055 [Candidatus Saccharibacteria bacterium]|nr:hypothetical protein [Candidatus Saccharibacteria bacterium]